jgi:hypothetical protein
MTKEIQKWLSKGYRYAFTYRGEGIEHALKHRFVTASRDMALKKAENAPVKEKNIRIFSLEDQ